MESLSREERRILTGELYILSLMYSHLLDIKSENLDSIHHEGLELFPRLRKHILDKLDMNRIAQPPAKKPILFR